jgi:hypothetical protein
MELHFEKLVLFGTVELDNSVLFFFGEVGCSKDDELKRKLMMR